MPRYYFVFLVIFSAACILGCGKKEWPSPNVQEEEFTLKYVNSTRAQNCLRLTARVSGEQDNLSAVTLLVQDLGEGADCPTCPFRVSRTFRLSRGDPSLSLEGNTLHLQVCGLESGGDYRFKLVGENIYPEIGKTRTRTFSPQEKIKEQK